MPAVYAAANQATVVTPFMFAGASSPTTIAGLETLAGAHLIGQFFSPRINLRSDGFGASVENRARFALLVHEEILRQVGDDFVVGMRWTWLP